MNNLVKNIAEYFTPVLSSSQFYEVFSSITSLVLPERCRRDLSSCFVLFCVVLCCVVLCCVVCRCRKESLPLKSSFALAINLSRNAQHGNGTVFDVMPCAHFVRLTRVCAGKKRASGDPNLRKPYLKDPNKQYLITRNGNAFSFSFSFCFCFRFVCVLQNSCAIPYLRWFFLCFFMFSAVFGTRQFI